MNRRWARTLAPFLLGLAAACGGGDESGGAAGDPALEDGADAASGDAEAEESVEEDLGLLRGFDLEQISFSEPVDGLGPRPVLEWSEVPGAAEYLLIIENGDGDPYWAWRGAEPTVRFGGVSEGAPGPVLHSTMGARVFALDAAGAPVGLSPVVELIP